MTSDALNNAIADICDDDTQYDAFGGKCIPYIGWYWRTVDFDAYEYVFGYIPSEDVVGFMESNKWGYSYKYATQHQSTKIRELLEIAVVAKTSESFQEVNNLIQSLK